MSGEPTSLPVVTVLLPVWNGGAHLAASLESVLAQTFGDFELLVVDDGSTDRTPELLADYARRDPRVRVLRQASNLGLVAALNRGLAEARGRYVARQDADDLSRPGRLWAQLDFLERHPEVGVCGSWVRQFGAAEAVVRRYPETDAGVRAELPFRCPLAHPSVVLRRSALADRGLAYDPAFPHAEDYALWAAVSAQAAFANLPEVLVDYRVHAGSVTSRAPEVQRGSTDRVRRACLERLGRFTEDELGFHCALAAWDYRGSPEFLARAEAWLRRLGELNRSAGAFPEPEFSRQLAEEWRFACDRTSYRGLGAGLAALKAYRASPLSAERPRGWGAFWKRAAWLTHGPACRGARALFGRRPAAGVPAAGGELPRRVLVVADRCFPNSGTLTYLHGLLDIHRRQGIVTGLLAERAVTDPGVLARVEREGGTVYDEGRRSGLFLRSYFCLLWEMAVSRRAVRDFRPDLILVSSGNAYLHLGLFLRRTPVVYVVHSYPLRRFRWGTRLFIRLARKRRDRFTTVSRFAAGEIAAQMGVPRQEIAVVYNAAPEAPPAAGGGAHRARVLTVGRVVYYRNPGIWRGVAGSITREWPEAEFVWVGDGPLLEIMRRGDESAALGPRVRFEGARENAAALWADAAVCFQPSLIENHSIAVLEAMAAGVPCVVSDRGGLPETVVDGVTGFVQRAGDHGGFCRRIAELLADPAARAALGQAGRRRARLFFSRQAQEAGLLRIYRQACAPRGGGG